MELMTGIEPVNLVLTKDALCLLSYISEFRQHEYYIMKKYVVNIKNINLTYLFFFTIIDRGQYRGVAKFGIALGSGPRGPGFKSRHSDQKCASAEAMNNE